MSDPGYILKLAKQDFKFAAAHFTLFPDGSGELLHGHNFRVEVELCGQETDPLGLLADVAAVKARIRSLCDALDEHVLIPEKCPLLELGREGDAVEFRLGERHYRLPASDVLLLPLSNVTIELLARHLFEQLVPALAGSGVRFLRVSVEESEGQSCSYGDAVPGS